MDAHRKQASAFDQRVLDLYDDYVHGRVDRRGFLSGAAQFAVGGTTAAALLAALTPQYAFAAQVAVDDPRIATDVLATLKAAGYVAEMAADGEDAWFRGDTEDYDLVVLDLGLPRMDGLSVLKRWRAAGRSRDPVLLPVDRRERIELAKEEHEGGDQQPLPEMLAVQAYH